MKVMEVLTMIIHELKILQSKIIQIKKITTSARTFTKLIHKNAPLLIRA